MRNLIIATILATAPVYSGTVVADPVFKEDFDGGVYTEGATLPTEPGTIAYGYWRPLGKSVYPGVVQVEDGSPCVALHVPPSENKNRAARIIGAFGRNNREQAQISEGIRLRLNFKCSAILEETFYIQIMGGDGKSRATVSMTPDGRPTFSFGGTRYESEVTIEPGRWYTLELTMPPSPSTLSIYKAALFEKGSIVPLVDKSGRVSRSVEEGGDKYVSFDAMHRVPGETLYIDNIDVETLH